MNRQEDEPIFDKRASYTYEAAFDWESRRRKEQEGWERLAVLLRMEPLVDNEEVSLPCCGTRGRYDFVEMLYRVASMAIEKRDEPNKEEDL